jgi:hypothetical protein
MECLLEIIGLGILNIRTAATAGDPSRCFVEADHIHNLPHLVKSYSDELLRFYLNVERRSFVSQVSTDAARPFEPIWARLEAISKEPSSGA